MDCHFAQRNQTVRAQLDNVHSEDRALQNEAYHFLMEDTEKPVDWTYEAWDELVEGLTHKDHRIRTISSQVLANLAKSDPKGRVFKDFDKLLAVTKDEKFVTARHCLQSIWESRSGGKERSRIGRRRFRETL